MLINNFERITQETLESVLHDQGFNSDHSRHCVFHRQSTNDIWHFISPDASRRGAWFNVKLYATSPRIDPLFELRFPNNLGIPFDSYCYLNRWIGIGAEHQSFKSETKEQLITSLSSEVIPLLTSRGLPILNTLNTLPSLVPYLRSPLHLGFGLCATGQSTDGKELLRKQVPYLTRVLPSDKSGEVELMLKAIEKELEP